MDAVWDWVLAAGSVAVLALAGFLCVAGLVLSCLSISGTWFVLCAAMLAAVAKPWPFPGWWTIIVFAVISAAVEVVEGLSGAWGVRSRGGSRLAGLAAIAGGLVGLALGSWIPIFAVGPLIGMLVGSFLLVYLVERRRVATAGSAVSIAWGAVMARVLTLFLKVVATLGMTAYLWYGIVRQVA